VRFDRMAPGGGMVIYTKVENGKCLLEFQFFYERELCERKEEWQKTDIAMDAGWWAGNVGEACKWGKDNCVQEVYFIDIRVIDQCDDVVFHCNYPVKEEEPARGLLLHPHLWNGLENPYLYKVSARLMCRESTGAVYPVDERKQLLPLRSFRQMDRKGWYLNGKAFEIRGVQYTIPFNKQDGETVSERIKADLALLRQMGANTICLEKVALEEEVISLCEEMGFVIWCGMGQSDYDCVKEKQAVRRNVPIYSEELSGKRVALVEGKEHFPTDYYFYCKACWSDEPFVHIVAKSLKRQENGNYSLTVYSNQKRVALYVDGVLFEFRVGAPEYVFEEISGKKLPLLLTVEAGECRKSMSFYGGTQ